MSVKVTMLRKDCFKNNHSVWSEWEGNEITSREKMFINAKGEGERVENGRCYALIPSLGLCLKLARNNIYLEKKKKITVPQRLGAYYLSEPTDNCSTLQANVT